MSQLFSQTFDLEKNHDAEFEQFLHILGGHIFFQTLSAAVEFDLFSQLRGTKMSRKEIAARLRIDEYPCRILLLGLCALRLIVKEHDLYSNSHLSDSLLCRQSEESMMHIVKWQNFINYRAMYHFYDALKKNSNVGLSEIPGDGANLYERLAKNPELETIFQAAMGEISRRANRHLTDQVDMSGVKFLLDVGGGDASNIISLAQKYPHLRASIFDFPSVCQKALTNIKAHTLGDRLGAVAGDVLSGPIPAGPDAIMFCHFFTIWDKETNLKLLKNAYNALPSGGRVLIFNMMQHDDETGPVSAALGSPYFLTLATGRGMLYSWKEYIDLFAVAGFQKIETIALPADHGVVMGFKDEQQLRGT